MSKRVFVFFAAVLALLLLCACCFNFTNDINHAFRGGALFANENGIDTFRRLEPRIEAPDITAFSVRPAKVGEAGAEIDVNAVSMGKNFDSFGVELVRGNWFTVSAIPRENNYVVIDSRLAVSLFFSLEAAGKELTIEGRAFTICGVYEFPLEPVGEIATNGRPFVFLAHNLDETAQAQYLYVKKSGAEQVDDTLYLEEQRQRLSEMLGVDGASLLAIDLSAKVGLINTLPFVFGKLLLACCILFCALALSHFSVSYLQHKKRAGLAKKVSVLLCFAGAFALFTVLLCSLPGIPKTYLPQDSIFDLGHYVRVFAQQAQAGHQLLFNVQEKMLSTSFILLFFMYLLIASAAVVLLVFLFASLWKRMREKR